MDEQEKELEEMEYERLKMLSRYTSFFHNSESGPNILADLKKSLDQPSYRPGRSTDEVIWREGRRSVYLDIISAVGEGMKVIESLGSEPQTQAEGVGHAGDPLD
jgi:hypothetical protein